VGLYEYYQRGWSFLNFGLVGVQMNAPGILCERSSSEEVSWSWFTTGGFKCWLSSVFEEAWGAFAARVWYFELEDVGLRGDGTPRVFGSDAGI
jgi:hypothetical protein